MNKTCYTPTSLWQTIGQMKKPRILRILRKEISPGVYDEVPWAVTVTESKRGDKQ